MMESFYQAGSIKVKAAFDKQLFHLERCRDMITLEGISKTFTTKKGQVEAVKDVDLHIRKGEIHGVIGYSGAGKSTLIRCVNLLERPTAGKVYIGEDELTSLSTTDLQEK